jgi:hypothetical protein
VLITQPRTPSALVGPPWLSCQPPCVLHSRAYAPPSRGLALRHCLHGSPRLILAVHIRDRAPPKSLPLMRADRTWPPLPPRPTPAAADRPLAAIFHLSVCRLSCCSTLPYSSGGRLSATVGLAAFCVSCSSWRPQHVPPPATPVNRRAAHTSASIIFSRRPTVALQPLSASSSPPVRTLRRRAARRFATACTAHHGSFLPCSPVPLRCQRRCAGVCRPPSGHPCRPAQHLLQPTALSLRFSMSACAECLPVPHRGPRRAAG